MGKVIGSNLRHVGLLELIVRVGLCPTIGATQPKCFYFIKNIESNFYKPMLSSPGRNALSVKHIGAVLMLINLTLSKYLLGHLYIRCFSSSGIVGG